jgi:putative transcriptional regulator
MNLTNQLLIATPDMPDERFQKAVILICEHNEHGALGININMPSEVTFPEILDSLSIEHEDIVTDPMIYEGGPVNTQCGFILHDADAAFASSILIAPDLSLTTSKDIIEAIAANQLDGRWMMALGCATWHEGQLEEEIAENSWLTCAASQELIFSDQADKWPIALDIIGIKAHQLSSDIGHA